MKPTLLLISILVCMSLATAQIIQSNEQLITGDTNVRGCYQKGQQFYLNENKDMSFTGIELYGSKFGNATGNIEFELRNLDCNGQPLGSLLSYGNKTISELSDVDGWFSVQMERVNLSYNIMYGIIWKYTEGNDNNYFHQRVNWNNETSGLLYASVLHKQCNDSWESVRHEDFLFRINGEEIPEEVKTSESLSSKNNNQESLGSSGGGSSGGSVQKIIEPFKYTSNNISIIPEQIKKNETTNITETKTPLSITSFWIVSIGILFFFIFIKEK